MLNRSVKELITIYNRNFTNTRNLNVHNRLSNFVKWGQSQRKEKDKLLKNCPHSHACPSAFSS